MLRATWRHQTRGLIAAIAHVPAAAEGDADADGGPRILCVSQGVGEVDIGSAVRGDGEAAAALIEEVRACHDWPLLRAYAVAAGDVVSAQFDDARHDALSAAGGAEGAAVGTVAGAAAARLLIARASGMLSKWTRPAGAAPPPAGVLPAADDEHSQPTPPSRRVSPPKGPRMPRAWPDADDADERAAAYASRLERAAAEGAQHDDDDDDDDDAPRATVPRATKPLYSTDKQPSHSSPAAAAVAVAVPLPPRPLPAELPAEPTPLRHARFDNPYRVLAMLEAGGAADGGADSGADGGAADAYGAVASEDAVVGASTSAAPHPLSRPSINSSAKLQSAQHAVESQSFEAEALPLLEGALRRRARREATAELDTPAAKTDRYADLTPLEPTTAPAAASAARPSRRRQHEGDHAAWRTMRALEPALDDLFTADREAEIFDTRRDTTLAWPHATPDAQVDATVRAIALGGGGTWAAVLRPPLGVATPLRLGEQRPLFE